jgi:hypothetical protein
MRRTLISLSLLSILLGARCGSVGGAIQDASNAVKDLGKSVEKAGVEVGKLKDIDPLAYHQLMSQTGELRTQLAAAQLKLAGTLGDEGVVVLKGNRLVLSVVAGRGDVTIDSWIGTEQNSILLAKPLAAGTPSLGGDFRTAIRAACRPAIVVPDQGFGATPFGISQQDGICDGRWFHWNEYGGAFVPFLEKMGDGMKTYADSQFTAYLAANVAGRGAQTYEVDVQEQLLELGDRVIAVQVTPTKLDGDGEWEISGKLTVQANEKRDIKLFTVSSVSVKDTADKMKPRTVQLFIRVKSQPAAPAQPTAAPSALLRHESMPAGVASP